jgi:methionyl-tRNA synthetase
VRAGKILGKQVGHDLQRVCFRSCLRHGRKQDFQQANLVEIIRVELKNALFNFRKDQVKIFLTYQILW